MFTAEKDFCFTFEFYGIEFVVLPSINVLKNETVTLSFYRLVFKLQHPYFGTSIPI